MATITNFECVDEHGSQVQADAFGNNVAFRCPRCSHPILAIARSHQRGSDEHNPAACRGCGFQCWIEVATNTLRLREVATPR